MENTTASQVVARNEVLMEEWQPYAFATELTEPVTIEASTVAMIDAAMIVMVDRPEIRNVTQEPAREQNAKRERKISKAQVMTAIM